MQHAAGRLHGGPVIASGLIGLLNQVLSPEQLAAWGWRLPFFLALPFGLIGLYVRIRLEDSPAFRALEARGEVAELPIVEVVTKSARSVVRTIGIALVDFSGYYIVFIYLTIYLQREAGFGAAAANWSTTGTLVVATVAIPLFGLWSDRIGRKRMLAIGSVGFIVLTLPMFQLMQLGGLVPAIIGHCVLGLCEAAIMGPLFATLAEVFGTRIRYSGFALGFNIAAIATGGTAPYIATWLIAHTGNATSPAYFLIATAVLTLLSLIGLRETAGMRL